MRAGSAQESRPQRSPPRRGFAALCLAALLLAFMPLAAQEPAAASEDELKAAFLYNFAGYVEWPPGAFPSEQTPLVFAVHGAANLADDLEALTRGRMVNGRRVEVRRLRTGSSLRDIHVLFVGDPLTPAARRLLIEGLRNGVLTVTESEDERPGASVINFHLVDERVRFDVSLPVARAAGLDISSRLLQVALTVIRAEP